VEHACIFCKSTVCIKIKTATESTILLPLFFTAFYAVAFPQFKGVGAKGPKIGGTEIASASSFTGAILNVVQTVAHVPSFPRQSRSHASHLHGPFHPRAEVPEWQSSVSFCALCHWQNSQRKYPESTQASCLIGVRLSTYTVSPRWQDTLRRADGTK